MNSISIPQARKLALLSQGLGSRSAKLSASKTSRVSKQCSNTSSIIEQLTYVQIDTISVVQRAHHHVLWSRNPQYHPEQLEQLVASKNVFEYWSHAAAYLPMKDYRFTLPRKHAIKTGQQTHWFKKDHQMMNEVLTRIEHEGPLMAKDFVSEAKKMGGWGAKPTKQALENLFIQGDLMIAERRGFHKVYDVTSRVLPLHVDTTMPTPSEHARYLVMSYLNAHGIGTLAEMVYQLRKLKTDVSLAIEKLIESNHVVRVDIEGLEYLATVEALSLLNKRIARNQVSVLSPFDNLLIQRKRASALFQFDYTIECYVPAAKREFGYFCLPILWGSELVARADCKVDKATSTLNVIHLFIEQGVRDKALFMDALEEQLGAFATFNQCEQHTILNVSFN